MYEAAKPRHGRRVWAVASVIIVYMERLRNIQSKLLALNIVCRTACSLYLSVLRHNLILNIQLNPHSFFVNQATTRHNISENRCCTYIIDARSFNWIFLRLFIYVMVVSATVRYGTSMSHISLPQTSMSVDIWVVKEKSKNYHNWTSSASYDVCTPAFLIYAVWLWLNLQKMNVWLNQMEETWGGGIVRFTHNFSTLPTPLI